MISTNVTLSDYVVKPAQQDYITAAEGYRMAKAVARQQQSATRFSALRRLWTGGIRLVDRTRSSSDMQSAEVA